MKQRTGLIHKYLIIFLIFNINISCGKTKENRKYHNQDLEKEIPSVEGNMVVASHIYLRATIQDSIEGLFLFDTGASDFIIDQDFLQTNSRSKLVIDEARQYSYGVGNGRLRNKYLDSISINFEGRVFSVLEPRVMKLDSLFSGVLDQEINGIIGYDLFKDLIININFDNNTFSLDTMLSREAISEYQVLRYKKEYRKPMINVNISTDSLSKFRSKLIFDLGSGREISLTHRKSLKHNLFENQAKLNCQNYEVSGIGGHSQSCSMVADSLFVTDKLQLSNISVELGKDESGALGMHKMYDGMLGLGVLKNYNIIINQNQRMIYLQAR